jgi:pyruvate,water dikinase
VFRGFARIIGDASAFRDLKKGEVAVSHAAAPELALLLDRAGALVTDVGGVLSHVVVVARALGIPVVVATGNAADLIHTGMTVTVNGDLGVVTMDEVRGRSLVE